MADLATRVGVDTVGGGTVLGGGQSFVKIDGADWAVIGDAIASHGTGIHSAATMSGGSSFVTINGVAVCRAGDLATCGHVSTGSAFVSTSA